LTFMIRILIIAFFFCTESFCQSLDQVINDYFAALGGKEQVYRIKSTRVTSFNWFRRNSEDNPEDAQAIKTRTILLKPHFKQFVSFDKKGDWNNEFYYNEKGSVMAMGDFIQRDSKPIQVSLCAATDLLDWYDLGELEFLGLEMVNGKEYYLISRNANQLFYFNKDTHLLVAKKNRDWPDKIEYYYDYRSTNLILQPFLFETFNGDRISYRQQTVEFEFNPEIDERIFYFNSKEYEKRNRPKVKFESVKLEMNETTLSGVIQSDFKSRRVLVDMWATWCGPCKKEFRGYDSLYYSMMDALGIDLLYLSIDKDTDKKSWERDVEKLALKGYHVRANGKLVESLQKEIFDGKVITIPRYILIDETGKILSNNFLRPSDPEFTKRLDEIFNNR